jgi:hypothetical protein
MIMITPANSTVAKGQTVSFMAMGMYSDNSTVDLTSQVTWTSSDTSVATISNDPGTQGLATAVSDGKSTISATFGGVTGSTGLTVATPDLNPAAVRDNGQAGYYQYGTWTVGVAGFNGTSSSADPATSPSASARWLLNVPAGTYDLWATWPSGASNATNATYSVYDGFTNLGSAVENQQIAPDGGNYGGVLWAMLGTFDVSKGRITVVLGASGADGEIVADAVLLVPSLSVMDSAGGGSTSSMAMVLTSSNIDSTAQMNSSAQSPQGPPSGQPITQAQVVAALPLQTSPNETSQQSSPPSIQISGLIPSAPSAPSLTVNYTAASTATMSPGSAPNNSIVHTSQGSRKVAKKHWPVRESLIRRIASDRVFHRRSTEHHHEGK